jgi:hypothetical protein
LFALGFWGNVGRGKSVSGLNFFAYNGLPFDLI